jgi:hypothetical protein
MIAPAARSFRRFLEAPQWAWPIAGAFVLYGLWSIAGDRHLHDEGLLTYLFSAWLRDAPAATFFFQKSRPVTAALYALTTLAGPGGFFVAHTLAAAAAIPMLAAVSARLGSSLPVVPALLLAASPMYMQSAPAGLSNADGVAATVLFLYLLIALQRPLLAGVVLGALPWVRTELALLVVVFGVYAALWDRKLLAGVLLFPAVYLLAGAVYHQSLLWPLAYPPALPAPMPGNPVYAHELSSIGLPKVLGTLAAVTPAFALALAAPLRRLGRQERALAIFTLGFFATMNLFPIWQIFNFGFTPRYSLGLLPGLALLAGRALEAWSSSTWPRHAVVPALVACLAAVPLLGRAVHIERSVQNPHTPQIVRFLEDRRAELGDRPIYTNIAILETLLRRSAGMPELRVRFLVGADQLYEIEQLSNPDNGQRHDLLLALTRTFYGEPVMREELTPAKVPQGALFVLAKDRRLELILPGELWDARLRPLEQAERYVIAEHAGAR